MHGFIAIEGLDGSGKSTQIELLTRHLHQQGIKTRFVHFPRLNEGIFGELIAKFLRGEFGDVSQVHPQLVATLFAEDRKAFAPTINDWLADDNVVLVDRYVLSNIAFQCAKLDSTDEKTYLRDWINRFEYEYNKIPKPDLSIYLDVPFTFVARALDERRTAKTRTYLNEKDDIHEKDHSLQKAVQLEYESLCGLDPTIHRIPCADARNGMRPIDAIHAEIVEMINTQLQR